MANGNSPISSRKSVPVLASWNLPKCLVFAPVKLPFSWPNKMLSTKFSGIAPQLTVINGRPILSEVPWIARATTSLPTPLSPVIRIGILALAPRSPIATTLRMDDAFPMRSSKVSSPVLFFLSRVTSPARVFISSALRKDTTIRSRLAGLTKKSLAPACIAATTASMLPLPVSTITGNSDRFAESSFNVSIPSRPGITKSSNIKSIFFPSGDKAISKAVSPSDACKVENPLFSITACNMRR